MKEKKLFHLKTLKNSNTLVYILLPEINNLFFDEFSYCFEFINKFENVIFLCNSFEISFYRLLLIKSKTIIPYRDKIQFDVINPLKLKEILAQNCLIVNISKRAISLDVNKKAIYCLPSNNSDIIFKQSNNTIIGYLKCLYDFLEIPEKNLVTRIDIAPTDIIKESNIANKYKDLQYNVIIIKNVMDALKISNFLKKNKLKKHLILISKNRISVSDQYLEIVKDHSYLDFLAFQLEATSLSCSSTNRYEKVISNLRINLSLFATFKESTQLLFDITESRINA
jgi:hypothetical protein